MQGQDIASQLKNGTVPRRVYSNRALKKLYDSLGIGKLDSVRALTPIKKEVQKNGHSVADMDAILLKKVEELTLYIIQQQKQLEAQQKELDALKKQLKK